MILRGHELTSILELAGTLSGVDFDDDDDDDVPVETGSHNHPEQAGDGQPNSSRHWKPKLLKMVGNVIKKHLPTRSCYYWTFDLNVRHSVCLG